MPALLVQPSAAIIGNNHQEFLNQAQMQLRPHLKLPLLFSQADAAVLFTVPALTNGASSVMITEAFWEITTTYVTAGSAKLAVSSSRAPFTGVGSILGGSGDIATTLVNTTKYVPGTIGTGFALAATTGKIILVAGDTITLNVITSTFSAGAGFLHLNLAFVD